MFLKLKDDTPIEWPIPNISALFPQTSFPSPITPESLPPNFAILYTSAAPQVPLGKKVLPGTPIFQKGKWVQSWVLEDMPTTELEEYKRYKNNEYIAQTQERLDTFAQTRGYDSILSACTYATSTIPKFSAEGQYCVNARDLTWSKFYEILNEAEAKTRSWPENFSVIEAELPALIWPV